jgi:hypothetical protein
MATLMVYCCASVLQLSTSRGAAYCDGLGISSGFNPYPLVVALSGGGECGGVLWLLEASPAPFDGLGVWSFL